MDEFVVRHSERKVIEFANGERYLVDIVCTKIREEKPNRYMAIGQNTATGEFTRWTEFDAESNPAHEFANYIRALKEIE